jgi:hypothetical protein
MENALVFFDFQDKWKSQSREKNGAFRGFSARETVFVL